MNFNELGTNTILVISTAIREPYVLHYVEILKLTILLIIVMMEILLTETDAALHVILSKDIIAFHTEIGSLLV